MTDFDSLTLNSVTESLDQRSTTFSTFNVKERDSYSWSFKLSQPNLRAGLVQNSEVVRSFLKIQFLNDNWDTAGAIAPAKIALSRAEAIVNFMSTVGQKIYNIAPGPKGEVMVDLRNNDKSCEIIFYPDKSKFVKFSGWASPIQGAFNFEMLPQLLSWLNTE